MRRVAIAETQIAGLDVAIGQAETEKPDVEKAAVAATAAALKVRVEMPASTAARAELTAEEVAAARLAEIDRALAGRGLRAPGRRERVRLTDEALALCDAHPEITLDPGRRAERAAERIRQAGSLDARAVAEAEAPAARASVVARRHRTNLALLVGARAEHVEGRDALAAELIARERWPGRVAMAGYLNGLGVDQAAAMVRLADPSAALAALIGPAGSGKTTALAALVRAHIDAGRAVHVLAPTAVAAGALGDAVGIPGQTLAKFLWLWQQGMSLPGRGDLILIDEASMAATLDVRHAVRVAQEHRALVRLIGDPRQARTVGAGGALELVAGSATPPNSTSSTGSRTRGKPSRPWACARATPQ